MFCGCLRRRFVCRRGLGGATTGCTTRLVGTSCGSGLCNSRRQVGRVEAGVVMTQSAHIIMAEGSFAKTSDGTKSRTEEMSAAMERLTFLSAKDEPIAEGCASSSSHPTNSSSEYFSTRIQSIMESRDKFETALEAEIEASRVHWSEVQQAESEGQGCAEANMRVFRSLQQQYGGPSFGFFLDWDDRLSLLGEKIAEGAQGQIYGLKSPGLLPVYADRDGKFVVKVFKLEGCSLEDLQKLWPPGMLLRINSNDEGRWYVGDRISPVRRGVMLKDGRFGFIMVRCWGDLRKAIDLRMQHNGNQAGPFSNESALGIMHDIAIGMRGLHTDGIVHRDLKASNLLIWPRMWDLQPNHPHGEFDVTDNDDFVVFIADFECSVGVVGTGFWRAPEILLGLKNGDRSPSLWSEKSDVYSYAMTCYEIFAGKIPFEHLLRKDYDVVLHGGRPTLPSSVDQRIQALLDKCWHHDPSERPSFDEIVDMLKALYKRF